MAVENIGRVTCIVSDKTGTITAGSLVLAHRTPADGQDEALSGPGGGIRREAGQR